MISSALGAWTVCKEIQSINVFSGICMTSGIFTFFNDLQLRNTEDPRLVTFGISISVNAVQDSNAAVFTLTS